MLNKNKYAAFFFVIFMAGLIYVCSLWVLGIKMVYNYLFG